MKQMPSLKQVAYYDDSSPAMIIVIDSGTKGYVHVILDEPGPISNYQFLEIAEAEEKWKIDLSIFK